MDERNYAPLSRQAKRGVAVCAGHRRQTADLARLDIRLKVRISPTVAEKGPIVCGLCRQDFAAPSA